MATPGDLVAATATALDLPIGTVRVYDRELSERGLRTKGGRGRSAARITSADAANLITAITAGSIGPGIGQAADNLKAFGTLPLALPKDSSHEFEALGLERLAALRQGHTFADFLSTFIESVAAGDFRPVLQKQEKRSGRTRKPPLRDGWHVRLDFGRDPDPGVEAVFIPPDALSRKAHPNGRTLNLFYRPVSSARRREPDLTRAGFLWTRTSLGLGAFLTLAKALDTFDAAALTGGKQ